MISGKILSNGICFGISYIIRNNDFITNKYINKNEVLDEINKFHIGYNKTIEDLKNIRNRANKIFSNNEDEIFDCQILLLEDESFINEVKKLIKDKLYTCETSISKIMSNKIKEIENIDDEYLRSRTLDIQDISNRLINNIYNRNFFLKENNDNKYIMISNQFFPSYILQIDFNKICGLIIEKGSFNSHSSIISRSLELPMLLIENSTKILNNNDYLILDAINNKLFINPTPDEISHYNFIYKKYILEKKELLKYNYLESVTKDNCKINLYVNINTFYDIDNIKKHFINGIGLYRTEFIFMNRNDLPSEEEQFNIYKNLILSVNNKDKPIIIRTLDVGGDKKIESIKFPDEDNPYLGWRGIRISLILKNIFHDQLRAILRSSKFGNVKIMFPMISTIEEVIEIKNEINKIKKELIENKIEFNNDIKIGIMIEVPSSIYILKSLIKELDFFSIGTNDLIQYTLAVDRNNYSVSNLYNFFYPSILISIKNIIDIIKNTDKELCICGEISNNKKALILLIGLGVKSFSVNINNLSKLKKIISKVKISKLNDLSNKILKEDKISNIYSILNNFIEKNNIFSD